MYLEFVVAFYTFEIVLFMNNDVCFGRQCEWTTVVMTYLETQSTILT